MDFMMKARTSLQIPSEKSNIGMMKRRKVTNL